MQFQTAYWEFIAIIVIFAFIIYQRIKTLRTQKGISQKDMAEKLHKSPSAYSRMENGDIKIAIEELPEIAEILGCTVDELLQEVMNINIQKNNKQVYGQHVQHQTNTVEELTTQFKSLLQQVLDFEEKAEERMRLFMKEIIQNLNKGNQ
jgi:transcriptional regulator with XRE-family HTH domain